MVFDDFKFTEVYLFERNGFTNLVFGLNSTEIDMLNLSLLRLRIGNRLMWLDYYIKGIYYKDIDVKKLGGKINL